MSDTTPTIEVPEPPQPDGSTSGGSGKKKVVAGGAGVVVLAAIAGGGAYAYNQLSGGGTQPEDVLPATTQIYARLDLDPSASQKIELFKLLNKVPEVGRSLGIKDPDKSDVRKLIFDEITENACPDIDYEKDVEPWLGDRVGVGANVKDQQFVIAVQVKDQKKAESGIDELFSCADEDYGIAFYEGYALLSDQQKTVDDVLDATKKESLADRQEFSDDMSALGEKGVAAAWFDAKSVVDLFADELGELSDDQRKQLEQAQSAAMALRVDGTAIELAGVSKAVDELERTGAPVTELPSDTVAALSISGVGEAIADQWDMVIDQLESEFGSASAPPVDDDFLDDMPAEQRKIYEDMIADSQAPDPMDFVKQFEAETGLKLPDDLAALLGKTFTLSVGSENLDSIVSMQGPDDLEKLRIAIRTTDGEGSAIDVMTKLADFGSKNGIPLVAEKTEDGAVLATSQDIAKEVAGGGDLGKADNFRSVMPYGDKTTQAFYLNVGSIIDTLLKADPPAEIRQQIEEFDVVDAVGFSAANVDGHSKFSLRVHFTD